MSTIKTGVKPSEFNLMQRPAMKQSLQMRNAIERLGDLPRPASMSTRVPSHGIEKPWLRNK